ncbi:MAG TPA: site-specific DNA-methyltransferase [Pyrinomonadaceae bacterium]|nr:site-specific DNA-methyltransferase [Pyrinomonadaceae bacterium]
MKQLQSTSERSDESDIKHRAERNRTLQLSLSEKRRLRGRLIEDGPNQSYLDPPCGTILGDCLSVARRLPKGFVDLLILDPPYNLTKDFHGNKFSKRAVDDYSRWLDGVVRNFKPLLNRNASIYICGEWLSSVSIYKVAATHFTVRNRITWEREKGRGALKNWKNASEDIWFCTVSDTYTFNVDAVKLRRKVMAPYKNGDGTPKDWEATSGGGFRDTYPSNLWTDLTVPFWSMPENTDHPTQKSEKLLAKLILASSNKNDFVFDPFLGSGTSSVVAKKLARRYLGIDQNEDYCLLAERRLELADTDQEIQGLSDGVFWERNTLSLQQGESRKLKNDQEQGYLLSF